MEFIFKLPKKEKTWAGEFRPKKKNARAKKKRFDPSNRKREGLTSNREREREKKKLGGDII